MHYQLFHNVDAGFWRGYEPGDRLILGYAGEIDPALYDEDKPQFEPTCERIFARHNADDRPDGQDAPSLSVGDVVALGPSAFTVEGVGFRQVTLADTTTVLDGPYRETIKGVVR